MIDTEKYVGHTRGPWRYYAEEEHTVDCWVFEGEDIEAQARVAFFAFTPCEGIAILDDPDLNLMIDAPELLQAYNEKCEEVERLRELIEGYKAIWDYFDPKGYPWDEKEFVALINKVIVVEEHGFETGGEEE